MKFGIALLSCKYVPFYIVLDGKNANGSRQRYNRKRETSYPKNESFSSQPRRSTSQKSKAFNKMPPQRGGHGSGCKPFSASSNCGRREEVRVFLGQNDWVGYSHYFYPVRLFKLPSAIASVCVGPMITLLFTPMKKLDGSNLLLVCVPSYKIYSAAVLINVKWVDSIVRQNIYWEDYSDSFEIPGQCSSACNSFLQLTIWGRDLVSISSRK